MADTCCKTTAWITAAYLLALPSCAAAGAWELKVCADADNLPFSNRAGEGFDNRIAELIADDLDADLTWVWLRDASARTRQRFLQGGECDMVMGVLDVQPGFLTSHAYYRTGYVFAFRDDAAVRVETLDHPALRDLRIGVPGGAARLIPPSVALANRGVVENQVHLADEGGTRAATLLGALVDGTIDLAIAWGPLAGAYAKAHGGLTLAPVKPEIDVPFIPMVASLSIGVRPEDQGLRDDIDLALSRTWDQTRAILADAGVPLIPLPPPAPSLAGGP